jgi:tryptophan synthase alpha chain
MRGIYLVGGYPDLKKFDEIFNIASGYDLDFIEIGLPFNDPVVDGPVIAEAIYEAVEKRIKTDDILEIVSKYHVNYKLIMTYANILYDYGYKKFSDKYANMISGAIIPDIPNKYSQKIKKEGFSIPIVPFVTPETRVEDLALLKKTDAPFIYYVGFRGVTGANVEYDTKQMKNHIIDIKDITSIPVIIGFGIKTKEDADNACKIADGFVIGTEVVKRQKNISEFKKYMKEIF